MKIKPFAAAVIIILLLLIQTTILEYTDVAGIKPNLLFTLAICTGLLTGSREGAIIGFFAGLAQDMATGTVFGMYAMIGAAAGYLSGAVNRRLYRDNIIVLAAVVFAVSVIGGTLTYLLYGWGTLLTGANMGILARTGFAFKSIILPEALYNCIAAVPLYYILAAHGRKRAGRTGRTVRTGLR